MVCDAEEKRSPDSNRGPLHYEATLAVSNSLCLALQGATTGLGTRVRPS
jgi:hypothetical protein